MFLNLKHSYSHLLSIHLETPKIALVLLLMFFFVRPQVLHENVKIPWLGIFSKAWKNLLSPCFFLIENLSGKIATGRWTGYVETSLLGITWQNKHHGSTFLPRNKWDVLQQTIYAPQIGFQDIPGHFNVFAINCSIQVCLVTSKDVKHNPGQHYQRPKNYELFTRKKKRDSQKKTRYCNRDSLRRASSW